MGTGEEYQALVSAFAPRPIRSEAELRRVEARIGELLASPELSPAEQDLLEVLSILVESWEDSHVEIPRVDGLEALKALLEENGLRQKDVVSVFGSPSIVSEVLAGKRPLSKTHITRLAEFFRVSPAVFFPVPASARRELELASR